MFDLFFDVVETMSDGILGNVVIKQDPPDLFGDAPTIDHGEIRY